MKSGIKIAIIVPIVAAIVIIPMAYAGYFNFIFELNQPITVRDGNYDVNYSSDFNAITNTQDAFTFSTNPAVSIVGFANHPDSYLNLSAKHGNIFYVEPSNFTMICFAYSVSGHFASLKPASITIFFGALGTNQCSVLFCPAGIRDKYQNVSPENLGDFRLEGPGNVSIPVPLLNESSRLPYYNFSLYLFVKITVKLAPDSSHLFEMGAQVNGLSKPVISTMNMTIVETS